MRRALVALTLLGGGAAAALAFQTETAEPEAPEVATPTETSGAPATTSAAPRAARPAEPPLNRDLTPMAEREAVIGLLNKRNGLAREVTLKPGQAIRLGDVVIRLRACEKTAPWEAQTLTGAFIQLDVRGRDAKWRRPFSGWLYKESPSLNVVQHPIYDVWPKSCTMRWPDVGPETLPATSAGAAPRAPARRSQPAPVVAEPADTPTANDET